MPELKLFSLAIDDQAASTLPEVVIARLLGETDPDVLSGVAARYLLDRDVLYTLAVMCQPDHLTRPQEENLVSRLHNALNANELAYVSDLLSEVDFSNFADISLQLMGTKNPNLAANAAIANREDHYAIIRRLFEDDWLAHVAAGYIIRWIVAHWPDPASRHQASLSRAALAIQDWCKAHKIKGGGEQNITRNIWPKYKSVSHLWASFHMMRDAQIDVSTLEGFELFCSTAQWLLELAAQIVPKGRRAGEAILTLNDAWTIPASHVLRDYDPDTDTDMGIVSIWNYDIDAHDIRNTGPPPEMSKRM